MGNSCRGSFKDKTYEGNNNNLPEENSITITHDSSVHSPTTEQDFPKEDNNNNNKSPVLVLPVKEPFMRRNMDNQAYYVLGHKTPNIRDLYTLSHNDGRIDYGEFVAMMQKGNAGIGRRTMRNSLNISMRDA
ncbi:hypothetical protein HID58_032498 [Brassica napus]|uniref:EF-hand domain-containing protein n=1 Tax=Brassica napus TaxID=3708 RepID=A0ABQ8BWI2_BRANA|nr:hypothetical protein HID58_032498 [Brassica napus]